MTVRFLQSRVLIGLICFVFGLAAMFATQKVTDKRTAQLQSPPSLKADNSSGMEQLLDNFYDDRFFDHSNDPFDQMRKMREKMMKQFEQPQIGGDVFDSWYQKKFGGGNVGEVKRREDDKFVYYEISVKGLNKEKLNVKVSNGQINISGQTETKSETGSSSTLLSSSFHRSFPVPAEVDANKVQMENTDDRIVIKFPKVG